jgi:hypothetical protein
MVAFQARRLRADVVQIVDLNHDGFVCGKRTNSSFGGVIIDNPAR